MELSAIVACGGQVMKCWNCGSEEVIYVGTDFPGEYPFQCPECGIYVDVEVWDGTTARDFEDA